MAGFMRLLRHFLGGKHAPWFLHHGTLLGALRDQDIIPWTGDVDVAIPPWVHDRLVSEEWNEQLLKFGYRYFQDGYAAGVGRMCIDRANPQYKEVSNRKARIPDQV